jgi:hypothetical protein
LFDFEVVPDAGCADADVRWSGGGEPATATGRHFRTTFQAGGVFTVSARCGTATRDFSLTVCPVDQWLERGAAFYGPAVDLSKVRVKGSWAVGGPAGTGWTCNDVIRFKRPHAVSALPDESTLIHELAHVWEHQSGQAQLLKGLVEQVSRRFGRDPYDFGGPAGVHAGAKLSDFKKEGQAEIIRNLWLSQHGFLLDMRGVPFDTVGYVDDLRRLVEGAGIGSRPSAARSLSSAVDGVVARVVNAVVGLIE